MGLFDKFKSPEIEPGMPTNDKKHIGRIIKLSERGYGFISCKDIPFTKIFFHWSALNNDTKNFQELRIGDNIEFEHLVLEGVDGQQDRHRALRIRVLDK